MGTRGTFGFRIDGKDKLTYNHYDSYPSELGKTVIDFVRSVDDWNTVKKQVRNLENVAERSPNKKDIEACKPYTDLTVSEQSTDDWYCLLRETQGNPQAILDCGRYMQNNDFIKDSLFCEYGYIINLDDHLIEFYEGFQEKPHKQGRYDDGTETRESKEKDFYACALVQTFPLDDIPENWMETAYQEEETTEEQEDVIDFDGDELKTILEALKEIDPTKANNPTLTKKVKEKIEKFLT